ncbi:hypothetical protein [Aromatoleum buckelii]|uniref:Uncharacterized protein n=1 Tax=Aromatoleum buckelii TaxID=200254 RepID=A0ABX1N7G5_9RHOO|nr:hypothetical protein [Aromatoleum buckelii]MCK0510927.1 hypothetical protein [Aromatoleum buckelii]
MNTAGRLLSIYTRLIGTARANDLPMIKVWAEVFELPTDSPSLDDEVVTCLQAMRAEMELLQTSLLAMGAPEELFEVAMRRFRNTASPVYLNQSWGGLKDEVSRSENALTFNWANWALRDEDENDLAADELAALRSELDSLEKSLQETEMAPYLRAFVQRQVDAIRAALRVYRVRGVKPIEQALRTVAGAYGLERSRLEAELARAAEPARTLLDRTTALVKNVAEAADAIDKIRNGGETVYALATNVAPFLLTAAAAMP